MIAKYKNKNNNNKKTSAIKKKIIEEKWEEFKNAITILEDWVRNIDKELGEKQFLDLNQKNKIKMIIKILLLRKEQMRKIKGI